MNNEANYGGGIAIIYVKYIYVEDLIMINSNAKKEGGGVYILNTKIIILSNSNFYNSSSESDAGCFYVREALELYFKNISIYNSSTFDKGGTAYFIRIQKLIFDDFIVNNSSASSGGMFFFDEKTNVLMNNSDFKSGYSSISGGFAFINGDEMNITIINSSFYEFLSFQDAAIILSYNILNLTIAYSSFSSSRTQNHGLGIIYLDGFSDGKEKFFNFFHNLFFNNSAITGATIYYSSNSRLTLINTTSILNQGSLFTFESDLSSLILIQSSFFSLTNYFSSELSSNSLIISSKCFLIINDTRIVNNKGAKHLFELTMKANIICNSSIITDYFLIKLNSSNNAASNSRLFYILDSKLISRMNTIGYSDKNLETSFQCIYFEFKGSEFTSVNDSFHNLSLINVPFLFYSLKSYIEINNAIITVFNIIENIFLLKKSNFSANHMIINLDKVFEDRKQSYFLKFDGLEINNNDNFISIDNCFFLAAPINVISIKNIHNVEIIHCYFTALNSSQNILSRAIDVLNVNFLFINSSAFHYFFNDICSCISIISELKTHITVNIKNTIFLKNEAYSSSVLYVRGNMTLLIEKCLFKENKAVMANFTIKNNGKGACMLIDCEYYNEWCFVVLSSTKFKNNFASSMGPTILSKSQLNLSYSNITFQENMDMLNFTNYFSAFPFKNYMLNQNLMKETIDYSYNIYENNNRTKQILSKFQLFDNLTVASGQPFNFSFLLTDSFDQQIITGSNIKAELTCISSSDPRIKNRLMVDKGSAFSNKGFFFFEKVTITFTPNSFLKCNIYYQYPNDLIFESSNPSAIDLDRSVKINLTIFVRECIFGEIYQMDETCYKCYFGTYAFHNPQNLDSSKKCAICLENAYCDGGKFMSPLRGYWRINNQSNLIQKCLNVEACLGVGDSVEQIKKYNLFNNFTELQKTQGVCGKGYEGNLCYYCQKGLARYKQNSPCQECKGLFILYVKFAFSFIFIVLYVGAQGKIFGSIEKEDPHSALLIKMILNHFQTISMMDLVDLGWTYDFYFYFSVKNFLSFLTEDFFQIDCMIQEIEGDLLVYKTIFSMLLPLLLSFFMLLFWISTFVFLVFVKKSLINEKIYDFMAEKMRITLLIFIFILYPEILKKGFSLINCIIIDEVTNLEVLAYSPDVKCWSSQHTFWVLTVSLPGIVFWGIFTPLSIWFIIALYSKNIYQILHQKEYNAFLKTIKNDKYKKSTIFKYTIVNIEKDFADKVFAGKKPPSKSEIGYIKNKQVFIESKEIKIVSKEELEEKLNLSSLTRKIKNNFSVIKNSSNPIIKEEEERVYRNTEKVIKNPQKLMEILNLEIESNITKDDLRFNKVLIQEEYTIEYDYKKKMDPNLIFPLELAQLKIPPKTIIIIRNLGFIYRGYRKEYFIWEIVMFSRKFIFIFIGNLIVYSVNLDFIKSEINNG